MVLPEGLALGGVNPHFVRGLGCCGGIVGTSVSTYYLVVVGPILILLIVRVSALLDQQVDLGVYFDEVAQVTCYGGLFLSSKSYVVVVIMCTTFKRTTFFELMSPLHWCNHKFALEPRGQGIIHYCLDVDPLILFGTRKEL